VYNHLKSKAQTLVQKYLIPGFGDFFVLIALFSLVAFQLSGFADDPGVGWHLATGEHIVKHQAFLYTDPLLWSSQPRAWISDQWLSDVIFFSIKRWFDWSGIYVLGIFLYSALYFLVLFPVLSKLYPNPFFVFIAIIAALKVGQVHFILRGVLFGICLFGTVFAILIRIEQKNIFYKALLRDNNPTAERRKKLQIYILFAALFALWANLHPSFFLGLFLILFRALSHLFTVYCLSSDTADVKKSKDLFSWKEYLILFLTSGLATLINPYGYFLHESIIALGGSQYFMNLNEEWLSPSFKEYVGQIVKCILFVVIGAYFIQLRRRETPLYLLPYSQTLKNTFYITLFLFFLNYSLNAVRFLPYFGIVSIPLFIAALAVVTSLLCEFLKEILPGFVMLVKSIDKWLKQSRSYYVTYILFMGFVFISALGFKKIPFYEKPFGPSKELYSQDAMQFLKTFRKDQEPQKIVVSIPDLGGAITYYGEGTLKAVIDDRNTLLGEEFYRSYFKLLKDENSMYEYLKKNNLRYLLFPVKFDYGKVYAYRSERYEKLFDDGVAVIFRLIETRS
jgi:hypothetical protein